MNLKVLFLILVYYTIFSLTFLLSNGLVEESGFTSNINLNDSAIGLEEEEQGGFFTVGVSFARFFGWTLFGIGLPTSTPAWFRIIIGGWQTLFTVFTVGFIIASIWDG